MASHTTLACFVIQINLCDSRLLGCQKYNYLCGGTKRGTYPMLRAHVKVHPLSPVIVSAIIQMDAKSASSSGVDTVHSLESSDS